MLELAESSRFVGGNRSGSGKATQRRRRREDDGKAEKTTPINPSWAVGFGANHLGRPQIFC